jgi:ankyrin repeat protein
MNNSINNIILGSCLLSGFGTTLPQLQAAFNCQAAYYRAFPAKRAKSWSDFNYLYGLLSGDGTEELRALIDFGAFSPYIENPLDPNVQDQFRQTILHFAAKRFFKNPSEDIDLLVRAGAIVDAKDMYEQTPLHFAAMYGHPEGIKKLLELGADINAKDTLGRTPLHFAVCAERLGVEKSSILLQFRANPTIMDKNGDTPLILFESELLENNDPEFAQQAPRMRDLLQQYASQFP